jgi:phospholipase/carboxylesterase
VALLGFSQGGSIAFRLGLSEPQRWRGVAALSTWLPEEAEAAGRSAGHAAIVALPVLIQHGTQDPMIALDRARDSKTRLEALGVKPDYREYPMGHQIGNESLRDLARWTEQVLGVTPEA